MRAPSLLLLLAVLFLAPGAGAVPIDVTIEAWAGSAIFGTNPFGLGERLEIHYRVETDVVGQPGPAATALFAGNVVEISVAAPDRGLSLVLTAPPAGDTQLRDNYTPPPPTFCFPDPCVILPSDTLGLRLEGGAIASEGLPSDASLLGVSFWQTALHPTLIVGQSVPTSPFPFDQGTLTIAGPSFSYFVNVHPTLADVPEPGTTVLSALATCAIVALRRRLR